MKITGKNPNSILNVDKTARSKASGDIGKAGLGESQEAKGADKLNLSAKAKEIAKAKELATPADTVDEAKVAKLQAMIDSGTYKVDAGAVADRLLTEHATLKE